MNRDKSLLAEKYFEQYDVLITMRRHLQNQISKLEESLVANKYAGEELADVGSDNFSRATNITILNSEENELDEIDLAIEKMYKGTYGLCEDCGNPIEAGRIHAKPFARYCLKHKEVRERRELGIDF